MSRFLADSSQWRNAGNPSTPARVDFDLLSTIGPAVETAVRLANRQLKFALYLDPRLPVVLRGAPQRVRPWVTEVLIGAARATRSNELMARVTLSEECDTRITLQVTVVPVNGLMTVTQHRSAHSAADQRRWFEDICTQSGEDCRFENVAGQGPTWHFGMQLERTAWARPRVLPAAVRNLRVLILMDPTVARQVLAEQLTAWGLQVETAGERESGLALLQAAAESGKGFHVAIIDSQMSQAACDDLAQTIKASPALQETCLLKLMSPAKRIDSFSVRQAGFSEQLPMPVYQPYLINALAACAKGTAPGAVLQSRESEASKVLSLPIANARVLLVDDNDVNRVELFELLTQLSGCQCDTAANGSLAVAACKRTSYDLILMDCQMPDMDGFEATRLIRELGGKYRTLPIIALTANTLSGDEERCLHSGMSAYLTKPIQLQLLLKTMKQCLDTAASTNELSASTAEPVSPFNWEELLDRCLGDAQIARQAVVRFRTQFAEDLTQLRAAVDNQDSENAEKIAHSLKGAAATLAAQPLADLLRQLELFSRQHDLQAVPRQLAAIDQEWGRLCHALSSFQEQQISL